MVLPRRSRNAFLLFTYLCRVVISIDIKLYSITIDSHANIPPMRQVGYFHDTMTDGCMPLQPPPSSGNWFVILNYYSVCTLNKIQHAREAGYAILFTYGDNRTITEEVRDAGYPIIVTFPTYATEIKQKYAVTKQGNIYATVTTENIHNEQDLRLTVYQDITESELPVDPNRNGVSSVRGITEIIGFFCVFASTFNILC